jgi:hypothetical protein
LHGQLELAVAVTVVIAATAILLLECPCASSAADGGGGGGGSRGPPGVLARGYHHATHAECGRQPEQLCVPELCVFVDVCPFGVARPFEKSSGKENFFQIFSNGIY